jgi:hypothetical protein
MAPRSSSRSKGSQRGQVRAAVVQQHPAQRPDQLRARRCGAELGEPCHAPVEQAGMRGVGLDYPVLLARTFTSVVNLHEPRTLDAVNRYVRGGLVRTAASRALCVPPTTATMSCDASHAPRQTLADFDQPCRRSLRNEKVRGSSPLSSTNDDLPSSYNNTMTSQAPRHGLWTFRGTYLAQ